MPAASPPRSPGRAGTAPTTLTQRLALILDWYTGMISERTGRLLYTYDPQREAAVANGSRFAISHPFGMWRC